MDAIEETDKNKCGGKENKRKKEISNLGSKGKKKDQNAYSVCI